MQRRGPSLVVLGLTAVLTAGASLGPAGAPSVVLASEGAVHTWTESDGEVSGAVVVVRPGTAPDLLPGSRVLAPGPEATDAERAAATAEAQRQRDWLAAGSVPGEGGPHADLGRDALLDLYTATHTPDGDVRAPFAAPTGAWRYVWPRDAAFAAVTLARTGHVADAVAVLGFFDDVEVTAEGFHARYRLDGTVPDDRGPQLDGAAWLLWASAETAALAPPSDVPAVLEDLAGITLASAGVLLGATDSPGHLPDVSSDYWELPETRLTLGTAAPVLTGLDALATLQQLAGRDGEATATRERLALVRDAVATAFGPTWPRHAGGRHQDAATALALPPFQDEALPGAETAWRLSARGMARPAGGLAPGEGWREPHYSWTPQTALYALTSATLGEDAAARERLDWLAAHTTLMGSVPEKVGPDGAGAQVAPLVWSSALVLLTLDELDRQPAGAGRQPIGSAS
ncbi:glycoside hydrolase family 15 [Serinibacter arcticus]|uniref:Glycoside hydrolase family 15 n=1 Tax=Serinibacter arcticus TaxID=1655435 RepID=A0A2U1ZY64_9MICO|nr:glycoside hydrolase family 15 [Serinibacter arcticus]PWD51904.1 glycoside hydrolase family 15 [Serinibacter arcticus]